MKTTKIAKAQVLVTGFLLGVFFAGWIASERDRTIAEARANGTMAKIIKVEVTPEMRCDTFEEFFRNTQKAHTGSILPCLYPPLPDSLPPNTND